jgi:hypothetical protein
MEEIKMNLLHDASMRNIDEKLSKYSQVFNDPILDKRDKLGILFKLKDEIIREIERMEDDVIDNG